MSVSISFGSSISPDIACEALTTVATSSCWAAGTALRLRKMGLLRGQLRIALIKLLHLAVGPPKGIAGARLAKLGKADPLKPAAKKEAPRQLIGQRLIVHKAVGAGGLDGLFVKAHRIERPVFDAGDLRTYQSGAVFEILRAILRPEFELPQVGGYSLQMLLPLG